MSHRTKKKVPAWHQPFMAMMGVIRRQALVAFRHLDPEKRAEEVQEVICNAMVAYKRLYEQGRVELAYPTVLAKYAIAQVNDGRKVGSRLNVCDVLSPYCQSRKKVVVERLDKRDMDDENAWAEIVVEDRNAGPADVARVRLDFAAWLKTLSRRDRKVAKMLATSETTQSVAKKFGVSDGRISQIRKELKQAWQRFVGDEPGPAAVAA